MQRPNSAGSPMSRGTAAPRTDIRERLLKAGTQMFSCFGYGMATVREIVAEANANEASINYYFGSKWDFISNSCGGRIASR